MKTGYCHHCGKAMDFDEKVYRADTCSNCGSDARCCLNCKDYAESASDRCREPQAELVSVKDRRNFCDYFTLRETPADSSAADRARASRAKLDALFKK